MSLQTTWPQVIIDATASSDTTTYTKVVLEKGADGPSSQTSIPSQALRIGCNCDAALGTVNLRFVLRDSSTVYKYIDVLCTAASVKANPDGSTGSTYVCVPAATNADFIDLIGHDDANGLSWYVGVQAFGASATTATIYLWATRAT